MQICSALGGVEALTSTTAAIMATPESKDLIGRIVKNKRAARIF